MRLTQSRHAKKQRKPLVQYVEMLRRGDIVAPNPDYK